MSGPRQGIDFWDRVYVRRGDSTDSPLYSEPTPDEWTKLQRGSLADAARAAAPPVERREASKHYAAFLPDGTYECAECGCPNVSPDRPAGLREADEALTRLDRLITSPTERHRLVEVVRAALLASDKPGLDEERLTDAMYEAGRKGLIYDGITTKDHADVIAAEYERLSEEGS